jgi:hypothetical protein
MATREYQRLAGWRRRRGKFFEGISMRTSLWLGKDHVLSVDNNRVSETYKRFYFRDIQAITMCRTRRRDIWNLGLSLVSLLFLALAINSEDARSFAEVMLGICVLGLVINNILGSACRTYIRTAVQVEELPPLNRVQRAEKIVARLRPLILESQKELVPEPGPEPTPEPAPAVAPPDVSV